MQFKSLIALYLLVSMLGVAYAEELVVVANAESGVSKLTRDQVIDIFLGRVHQFPSGHLAEPIDQPEGSYKAQFYRNLVGKEVAEINAYWARLVFSGGAVPPLKTNSQKDVVRFLLSRRSGIAYMDRSQVSQLSPKLIIVYGFEEDGR